MPELAEIETARRHLEKALRGKIIASVDVDRKDRIVFDKSAPSAVVKALEGAKVTGSGRKGKYFWLELDRRPWPVFHLGMSGHMELLGKEGFGRIWGRNERGPKGDAKKAPPYCKLLLKTQDGVQAAITDPRRFGRIRLAKDPLHEKPISELGFDPLEDFPSSAELRKIFAKRKLPIKALLLDQGLFAGVGNWLADEILFQARIAPRRLANSLGPQEVGALRSKVLGVVKKAVKVEADYTRFPKSWLFHQRWGKNAEAYTSLGYKIEHATVGGRTTAWVPALQS